jgi:FixJ family two-component response regulator
MFPDIESPLFGDEPTAFAVGCDWATCQTLKDSLRAANLRVECYASIEDFLAACDPAWPGCVFLDWGLAEGRQQEVFQQLAERGVHLPVLLLATRGDLAAAVRAIRLGAFHFLSKSCSPRELAEAAREAILWEAEHHAELLDRVRIEKRLGRLSDAEREVLDLVVHGMSNGAISSYLGLSVRGVENRRSSLMKKMRAKSVADLLRQAIAACCGPRSLLDRRFQVHAARGGR